MQCPVCLSNQTMKWHDVTCDRQVLPIRKCSNCLSLFQHPLPADVNAFYDEDYYSGEASYSYHDERKEFTAKDIVYRDRLKTIRRHVPGGRFLDVGCSFGGFVLSASRYFEARGIDVSAYAVNEGNRWLQQELNSQATHLFRGTLTSLPAGDTFRNESFDVITLVEVAEHLARPRDDFKAAYNLLKPGGVLLVQTANFAGWQAVLGGPEYHYFMPGHLTYFTADSLKSALGSIGFNRFTEYIPVDFSLLAKLKKSARSFESPVDYARWLRTSWYHVRSFFKRRGRPLTSSYVLYAFKD